MVAGILWYVAWSRVSGEKVGLDLVLGDLPPVWLQRGRRITSRQKKEMPGRRTTSCRSKSILRMKR